jgi:hypothetical protein
VFKSTKDVLVWAGIEVASDTPPLKRARYTKGTFDLRRIPYKEFDPATAEPVPATS